MRVLLIIVAFASLLLPLPGENHPWFHTFDVLGAAYLGAALANLGKSDEQDNS
jgi:hypothetical protein